MKLKQLLLYLILLLTCSATSAQDLRKFKIVSFEKDQFDMSARNSAKKIDGNGDMYALIKVTSANPDDKLTEYDFNFSNLRSIKEMHDGELWVYVQRNAKMVSVSRKGFAKVNRYDLQTTIEPGVNYVMVLSPDAKVLKTQMVTFNVKPAKSNALITVVNTTKDGTEQIFGTVDQNGSVARALEYGIYTYKVISDNYFQSEGRFTLKDQAKTHIEDVTLKPNCGTISFKCPDESCEVYVDGISKGKGAIVAVELKTGDHQVECRKEGHRPSSEMISVSLGEQRTVKLKEPTPIYSTLAVVSTPLGAEIYIDDVRRGKTPMNINDIIVGKHTVKLTYPDYRTVKKDVEVLENQTANVNITLYNMGTFHINSTPEGAALFINGKEIGATPQTIDLIAGDHKVMLKQRKYRTFKSNVHFLISDSIKVFKMRREMFRNWDIYLQTGFNTQTDITASIGANWRMVNVQFDYYKAVDKEEEVRMFRPNSYGIENDNMDVSADHAIGARVGYNLTTGRFRFTPQIGFQCTSIKGEFYADNWEAKSIKTYCASSIFALRMQLAIFKWLQFVVTPECISKMSSGKFYDELCGYNSSIKNFGTCFRANGALCFSF